jgi:hypothetical protein
MSRPTLWEPEATLFTIRDIKPRLASWDKSTHPSQLRLQAYRQPIMDQVLPLLPENYPLFLHLDVDVEEQEHLLRHHDLENYLTPLFGRNQLNAVRFFLVTARKFVGGGSRLEIGIARPMSKNVTTEWNDFSFTARGSVQSKAWKENLRNALAATNPDPLTPPGVEVQIAWVCSPERNWVSLWKPTGDCMGPILGEENPLRPFAPNDDRIVALKFHRTLDLEMGNAVQIDMWWRAIENSQGNSVT